MRSICNTCANQDKEAIHLSPVVDCAPSACSRAHHKLSHPTLPALIKRAAPRQPCRWHTQLRCLGRALAAQHPPLTPNFGDLPFPAAAWRALPLHDATFRSAALVLRPCQIVLTHGQAQGSFCARAAPPLARWQGSSGCATSWTCLRGGREPACGRWSGAVCCHPWSLCPCLSPPLSAALYRQAACPEHPAPGFGACAMPHLLPPRLPGCGRCWFCPLVWAPSGPKLGPTSW